MTRHLKPSNGYGSRRMGGKPFCPDCGTLKVYTLAEMPIRWDCAGCLQEFSVTFGTFVPPPQDGDPRLSCRDRALCQRRQKHVGAANEPKCQHHPESAYVMFHKPREAMGAEVHGGGEIGAADRQAEVDGSYFGHVRPANRKTDWPDRRRPNLRTALPT